MSPEVKLSKLISLLQEMDTALIAFSGGVDSAFLTKIAYQTLGHKTLAVTAVSETYTQSELVEAKELAQSIGIHHEIIQTEELANPNFFNNPPQRCYYCKKELYGKLRDLANGLQLQYIIDGTNADDLGDFRPGHSAARELGVRSPLREVGLNKEEIRTLSKELGLPTWNKPAMACLSSRFPYGDTITIAKLEQVRKGEEFLKSKGFSQFRVRHHGALARIEIPLAELPQLTLEPLRLEVIAYLKSLGFAYVTLDLAGFSSGSMNLTLAEEVKNEYRTS